MTNKHNEAIDAFFYALDRSFFMETDKELAKLDSALPIGWGQTISQPSLVLSMTQHLEPDPALKTLEVGTGSGYQTAFLAQFSREVYTIERIAPLRELAENRLAELGYANVRFFSGDGSEGLPEHAPFDRIMVTAAAREIPAELLDQLAPGGILVIPVGDSFSQDLLKVQKDKDGQVAVHAIFAVRFVPLVGKYEI